MSRVHMHLLRQAQAKYSCSDWKHNFYSRLVVFFVNLNPLSTKCQFYKLWINHRNAMWKMYVYKNTELNSIIFVTVLSRRSPPVGKLRRTPRRLTGNSCNNSLLDQSLEIVWDNNSPSPSRTLALGLYSRLSKC